MLFWRLGRAIWKLAKLSNDDLMHLLSVCLDEMTAIADMADVMEAVDAEDWGKAIRRLEALEC